MKRLRNLFILILLTMSVFVGGVSAKKLAKDNEYNKSWDGNLTNAQSGGNNYISVDGLGITNMPSSSKHAKNYLLIPYYIFDKEDEMTAYCADPHLNSYNKYTVERILGTSDDETVKKVDLGVMAILKDNYQGEMETSSEEYMAKSIALRSFLIVVGGESRIKVGSISDPSFLAILSAHANLGLQWADEGRYKNNITTPSWSKDKYVFGTGSNVSTGGNSGSGSTTDDGQTNTDEFSCLCSKTYCSYYNGDGGGCAAQEGCTYQSGTCKSTSNKTMDTCSGGNYSKKDGKCYMTTKGVCPSDWTNNDTEKCEPSSSSSSGSSSKYICVKTYCPFNKTKDTCNKTPGCTYNVSKCVSNASYTTDVCSGSDVLIGGTCQRTSSSKCSDGWKEISGALNTANGVQNRVTLKATQLSTVAYGKTTINSPVIERAKALLTKAYEAMENGGDTPNITTVENKGDGQMTITFEYKNFTANEGKIVIGDLTCDGGSCGNYTVSGDVNAETGIVTSSNGKIDVTFSIPSGDDCANIKYTLKYEYDDPNLQYVGAYLVYKNGTNAQNLYAIQNKGDDPIEDEVSGTIPCGDACKTNISEPICESDALGSIKTDDNIKKCILDNVDDAGNTYELTNSKGLKEKNKYCSVFCKEDYDTIQLEPVVPDVKCGRYFNLNSKIEGKKTCYTGGPTDNKQIDKEQYLKDIIAAQKEMIEAYNEYLKWKTAWEDTPKEDTTTYTNKEETPCTPPEGETSCEPGCKATTGCPHYYVEGKVTGYNYTVDSKTGVVTVQENKVLEYTYSDDEGQDGECNSDTCQPGDSEKLKTNLENEKLTPATERLRKAIEKYENIIKEYNACTTTWTNEFTFAQEIEYYYDERHDTSDSVYKPYYDLLDDNSKKLEKNGEEVTSTSTILVCTGDANDQYECQGEEKPYDLSIDNGSLGTYNYNSGYGDTFKLMNYVKCSKEKCELDKESYVSQALFIKKEVAKSQEYQTPTAFAQIAANGKVTLIGDYTGTEVQLETLEHLLPVSTKAVGGGVFKLLIRGLGEYYDEDNLFGRLINHGVKGERGTVIEVSGSEVFKDEYACYYESLCRPKDCPDCIFTCEGDGCSWIPCEGDQCSDKCVSCIFNLGELSITHKTISTSNFNSAGRTFGYNWVASSSDPALALLVLKANKTISQIEEKNETIYGDTKDTENSEFAFSIKLTPEIISDIKAYNDSQSQNGGYINDSLTCYDATIDGTTYKNIYCYSDYIDSLMEKYSGQMTFGNNRPNDKASRGSYSGDYWQLWTQNLEYIGSEDVIGGPSWR